MTIVTLGPHRIRVEGRVSVDSLWTWLMDEADSPTVPEPIERWDSIRKR